MALGWKTKADMYRKIIEWYEKLYGDGTAPDAEYLRKNLSQKCKDLGLIQ